MCEDTDIFMITNIIIIVVVKTMAFTSNLPHILKLFEIIVLK